MKNTIRIPESIYDAAEKLDPYAIVFRYPGENRVDDYRAKQAIGLAQSIVDWVKAIHQMIKSETEGAKRGDGKRKQRISAVNTISFWKKDP